MGLHALFIVLMGLCAPSSMSLSIFSTINFFTFRMSGQRSRSQVRGSTYTGLRPGPRAKSRRGMSSPPTPVQPKRQRTTRMADSDIGLAPPSPCPVPAQCSPITAQSSTSADMQSLDLALTESGTLVGEPWAEPGHCQLAPAFGRTEKYRKRF